ncbi:MAG TPA: MerR family transcriptional regulator, partial [Kofleriaceae bacterium]|nr:MerR family transcriptional regulator [Kofleriaceae bacterium]
MAKKQSFKIAEACRELDIQPYVLRYWETEFPFLKPAKANAGQRVYSASELQVIRRIKELLYDEGYTIAGAKKKLEAEIQQGGSRSVAVAETSAAKGGDSGDSGNSG